MIPKECKRLIEVEFPIGVVSKHAAGERLAARQERAGETGAQLQEPVQDPAGFPRHEVTQVADYCLSVDA